MNEAKRRSDGATERRRGPRALGRGFSLIELLLAVFILGIGVIAISALFPAGIAQQRQSVDDIIGPIVANNALSILRSKLRPDDFGTYEELGWTNPLPTIEGDWPWGRPAFFTGGTVPAGSISIFDQTLTNTTISEIPWNTLRYGPNPPDAPDIVIGQHERYYPMRSLKPQYVWDCMFRRFQGKVLVAIFVYRVTIPGGGRVTYAVTSRGTEPPLPFRQTPADGWDADDAIVLGTPWDEYSAANQNLSWQEPRQWILDLNNNIHRVLSQNRPVTNDSDPIRVEMVRPVPQMALARVYYFDLPTGATYIWYIPAEVEIDTNEDGTGDLPVTLSTVYATVREL